MRDIRLTLFWLWIGLVLTVACCALITSLLADTAGAAEAAIEVPEEIAEHHGIQAVAGLDGTGYAWFVLGPRGFEQWWATGPNNASIVWCGPPGTYRVMLVVLLRSGALDQGHATVVVTGGATPDPPAPGPDPPAPQRWQVVIVYESGRREELPRGQQVLLSSLTFREALAEAGHRLVAGGIVDQHIKDSRGRVPEALAPYFAAVSADESLPRLCIAPMSGGAVIDFPLPETEAGVLELLRTARPAAPKRK